MSRLLRRKASPLGRASLVLLILSLSMTLWVGHVAAETATALAHQPPSIETTTIVVDYTTFDQGHRILGTIVAQRPTTPPYLTSWTFVGSFNGGVLSASGLALEEWVTPGEVVVVCRALSAPPVWDLLFTTSGRVVQASPTRLHFTFPRPYAQGNQVTFQIAVDGVIREPGQGGQSVYHVSEVGDGQPLLISGKKVTKLPGGKSTPQQSWAERVPVLRDLLSWLPH